MNTPSAWNSLLLAKVSKITPPSNANSCEFWVLKVSVFGKSTRIQLKGFCLAVFCYRWLIGWPFRECWKEIAGCYTMYLYCLLFDMWILLFFASYSRLYRLVCSMWLWHLLAIRTCILEINRAPLIASDYCTLIMPDGCFFPLYVFFIRVMEIDLFSLRKCIRSFLWLCFNGSSLRR